MSDLQSIIENNIDSYLNNKSTVDNRQDKVSNKSIIDYHTNKLRTKLNDETIGEGMVALALEKLGEAQLENIADYVLRKSHSPGRAFVKICHNAINAKKGLSA